MGQLTLSKGPVRMGIFNHIQEATVPSKGFVFAQMNHSIECNIILCVPSIKRKYSSVQVKNKCRRISSMESTVANNYFIYIPLPFKSVFHKRFQLQQRLICHLNQGYCPFNICAGTTEPEWRRVWTQLVQVVYSLASM
jgi:hypothetical protein